MSKAIQKAVLSALVVLGVSSCAASTTTAKAPSLGDVSKDEALATQALNGILADINKEHDETQQQIANEVAAAQKSSNITERSGHFGIFRALDIHLQDIEAVRAELSTTLSIKAALDNDFVDETRAAQYIEGPRSDLSESVQGAINADKTAYADAATQSDAIVSQVRGILTKEQALSNLEAKMKAFPIATTNDTPEEARTNQITVDDSIEMTGRLSTLYSQISQLADARLLTYAKDLSLLAETQESAIKSVSSAKSDAR